MQEFMIFIHTKGDHLAALSPEEQQAHVQKIGNYISGLMDAGQLKGAQPLDTNGAIIHCSKGIFKDGPFNESKEIIVGYFHVLSDNLQEAIHIAKANPMFEIADAKIEVRPIKQMKGIN